MLTSSIDEYVPECDDKELVSKLHMTPASSLDEAVTIAKKMIGKENPTITAIPDGVSVVVI